jgi:hypothetical protein
LLYHLYDGFILAAYPFRESQELAYGWCKPIYSRLRLYRLWRAAALAVCLLTSIRLFSIALPGFVVPFVNVQDAFGWFSRS